MLDMRHDLSTAPDALEAPAGRSRLLSRISRDIGVAAIATEFGLTAEECEPELATSIQRGARYLTPRKMALAS
jgi:hypothetical protein